MNDNVLQRIAALPQLALEILKGNVPGQTGSPQEFLQSARQISQTLPQANLGITRGPMGNIAIDPNTSAASSPVTFLGGVQAVPGVSQAAGHFGPYTASDLFPKTQAPNTAPGVFGKFNPSDLYDDAMQQAGEVLQQYGDDVGLKLLKANQFIGGRPWHQGALEYAHETANLPLVKRILSLMSKTDEATNTMVDLVKRGMIGIR